MARPFTDADAARIRAVVQATVDEVKAPGCGIGVVAGGKLVFAEGFGFADIESGRKQDPALRQRIGSITKTMVGLSAMALVDEGRLSLDDRLVDHVPEVELHGDGGAITVRHLMTHTSGIGEVATREEMREVDSSLWSDEPDADVLGLFPKGITLDVPAGTKWSYANLGFALLGEIVERLEGVPIAEVVRRRVFEPLGMTNSDLLDRPHPDLTTPYHRNLNDEARDLAARDGREVVDEPTVDGLNVRGTFRYIRGGGAAGAVQSTVIDMAKYAVALLRQGGGIVKPETFATMIAPQWSLDGRMESWGLTFQRQNRYGRAMFGHGGGVLGGWNTMLLILPDDDMALIMHCNAAFEGSETITSRALAALLDEGPRALSGDVDEAVRVAAPGVYQAIEGVLTNFRVMGSIGRVQIKDTDEGLKVFSRRGPWKVGVRLYPGEDGDPNNLLAADNPLEPGRIVLRRSEDGTVTGFYCSRLVVMEKTADVAPWA